MKKLFYLIFLLVSSCSVLQYEVVETYDKFENLTTQTMKWNKLDVDYAGTPLYYFNLMRFSDERSTYYFIGLTYYHSDWCFIKGGKSLSLLIDNKKFDFVCNGEKITRENYGQVVLETAYYPIDKEMIKRIMNAKSIEIKLYTEKFDGFAKFNKKNFQRIKEFYNKYIIND